ncbi:hypothetical protein ABIC16_003025 [Sphingomonas sp. PvP055]
MNSTGSGRDGHAAFGGVVGIVQADAQELADLADARAEARVAFDRRERLGVELRQIGEDRGRKRGADHVGDLPRQVAERAVGVDQAGAFFAWGAVAN